MCAADTFRAATSSSSDLAHRAGVDMTREGGSIRCRGRALQARAPAAAIRSDGTPAACTRTNLMGEPEKIRRIDARIQARRTNAARARRDSGTERRREGARFTAAAGVTGIVLTKLGKHRQGRHRGGDRARSCHIRWVGTGEHRGSGAVLDRQ